MSTVLVDRSPVQSFNFTATHNGIACIESIKPEDKGTERQLWFTRSMLRDIFDVTAPTVTNHVEALVNRGVLEVEKNFATSKIPTNGGVQETTLYDLKVFNYLVMRLDTDRAWAMKERFNDVLVKAETQTPTAVLPQDYETALVALLEKVRENKRLEAECDRAIKTKTQFVEGRDAKVCGELGGLRTQNENLRKQIGISKNWKQVKGIEWLPVYFNLKLGNRLFNIVGQHLSKLSRSMQYEVKPIPDIQWGKVNAYHIDVIDAFRVRVHENPNYLKEYRV